MFSNLLSYVQQFMVPNLFSPIYLFNASYFHQFIQLAMQCDLCSSATQVVCFCLPWIVEHFVRNPAGHGVGCTNLQMDPVPAQEDLRQRIGARSKGPRVDLVTIKTLDQVVKIGAHFCRSRTL